MAEIINFEDAAKSYERDKKVAQLLVAGVQPRRIAEELDITVQEVHAAHSRLMGAVPDDYRARALQLSIETLDAVKRAWFAKATGAVVDGKKVLDVDAAKLVITVERERNKLLGNYPLPTRDEPLDDLKNNETTTEQLLRAINEIRGKKTEIIDVEAEHVDEPDD